MPWNLFEILLNNHNSDRNEFRFILYIKSEYFCLITKIDSMIQRIQSLYLLMTSLLSLIFLNGSYLTFFDKSGAEINLIMTGLFKSEVLPGTGMIVNTWILPVIGILIPVLSIIAIFLFRMRTIQLKLVRVQILLIIIFIAASVIYSFIIISKFNASFHGWYKLIIPVLQMILSVLALRGIKKDDELVKSYDRLR